MNPIVYLQSTDYFADPTTIVLKRKSITFKRKIQRYQNHSPVFPVYAKVNSGKRWTEIGNGYFMRVLDKGAEGLEVWIRLITYHSRVLKIVHGKFPTIPPTM